MLVHNGIIENYQEIKRDLIARGHRPLSETDSELFGFLVLEEMEKGHGLVEAVRKSFPRVRGQCSVVVMSEKEPGTSSACGTVRPWSREEIPKAASSSQATRSRFLNTAGMCTFLSTAMSSSARARDRISRSQYGKTGRAHTDSAGLVRREARQARLPSLHAQGNP